MQKNVIGILSTVKHVCAGRKQTKLDKLNKTPNRWKEPEAIMETNG